MVIIIDKINSFNFLNFATFFFDNKINELFIISSSGDYSKKSSNINILVLTGKLHKEIKNSNETTNCIKILYDDKSNKVYIIALNESCIKSYDYDQNILYKKYSNKDTYVYTYKTHMYIQRKRRVNGKSKRQGNDKAGTNRSGKKRERDHRLSFR